jgi:RNA polymerase sigma-70 factor (ECF subfamily)
MSDVSGDDQFVVDQIVSGRKELFRVLAQRYEKAVYAMGLSFFRNAEDAADFVQEVFLKSFRSLAGFQGRSRFSTWLYRIAYNTAVNSLRRQKGYSEVLFQSLEAEAAGGETPERLSIRSAVAAAVREAVRDLSEERRICVDLFFFYDQTYQEIETITGFPVNTIKSHVFRAKKLLKEKLAEIAEGGFE